MKAALVAFTDIIQFTLPLVAGQNVLQFPFEPGVTAFSSIEPYIGNIEWASIVVWTDAAPRVLINPGKSLLIAECARHWRNSKPASCLFIKSRWYFVQYFICFGHQVWPAVSEFFDGAAFSTGRRLQFLAFDIALKRCSIFNGANTISPSGTYMWLIRRIVTGHPVSAACTPDSLVEGNKREERNKSGNHTNPR